MAELENLRNALLITLSIVLLVLVYKRFKRYVRERHLPQLLHAELLDLTVAYHPARLLIDLRIPEPVELHFALLDQEHRSFHEWPSVAGASGITELELQLPEVTDANYFLEVRTPTQRTVRQFRVIQR